MKDNHPIDALFREGLVSRKATPSPAAWTAIEANMTKGNGKKGLILYLAIAASVSLLFAFTWSTMNNNGQETNVFSVAEVIKQAPQSQLSVELNKAFELQIPAGQKPVSTSVAKAQTIFDQPLARNNTVKAIAGIQPMEKHNLRIDREVVTNQFKARISFDLYAYIDPIQIGESKGIKFNLIKSLASVAKGVNDGKKAINSMRKSKIEFINEELNYGQSEKSSTSQATIDEDSPSNEK